MVLSQDPKQTDQPPLREITFQATSPARAARPLGRWNFSAATDETRSDPCPTRPVSVPREMGR